jgi:polyisoprenoid-binding protein YceI
MHARFPKRTFRGWRLTALGVLVFQLYVVTASARTLRIDTKDSSLTFTVDATLHKFNGEAVEFTGSAETGNAVQPIRNATLHFSTASITTFHRERDRNMREWLNVKLHPRATFRLGSIKLLSGDFESATSVRPARFAVSGAFTLNGVTRTIAGSALAWRQGNGVIVTGRITVDTLKYGLHQIKQALVMTVGTKLKIAYRFAFVPR